MSLYCFFRRSSIAFISILVFSLSTHISAAQEQPTKRTIRLVRVMVFTLTGTGINNKQLEMISNNLLVEIRKLKGVTAMGMDEITAMLSAEENEIMASCKTDQACLTSIAGAIGADFLILGDAGRLGQTSVLTTKCLNMKTAQVINSVTKKMKGGTGEEFLEALGPTVEELFPGFELRSGLKRGVAMQIVARWNPPPIKPWITITTASVTGAMLVATTGFLISMKVSYNKYSDLVESSRTETVSGQELVTAEDRYTLSKKGAAIFGSLTILGAATSGLMYFFTDWQGKPIVTPQITPQGAIGIGVRGNF